MLRVMQSARRWLAVAALASAASALVSSAGAQDHAVTLPDLALRWSAGHFASPLICQLDGEPLRGLRRIVIAPAPARVQPPANRVRFVDLEVEEASRCFTELAGDTPNVTGSLLIRLPGRHSTETVERDFREALRRARGFEFGIAGGVLQIQAVTQPASPVRAVDFSGGRAELREVREGSDIARLLAPFRSPRKLMLELTARDGTELSFPLYSNTPRQRSAGD
jgi:hypothetical protein